MSHRTPAPEPIASLAGTIAAWEDTQAVDEPGMGTTTSGTLQRQHRVEPNLVRALPDGEAVVVQADRWAHVAVARAL